MRLLRSCGKLVQAYGKTMITCQMCYNRDFVYILRIQGYVTAASKFDFSTGNIEKSKINNNTMVTLIGRKDPVNYTLFLLQSVMETEEVTRLNFFNLMKAYRTMESCKTSDIMELSLLRCCTKIADSNASLRRKFTDVTWNLIEKKLGSPDVNYYNTLLNVHEQNMQRVDPENFLENMKVNANSETYECLLNCVTNSGDVKSTLYVLSLMKSLYSLDKDLEMNSLIKVYANSNDMKSALSNLEIMKNDGREPTLETWVAIAYGYAQIGNIDEVMKILIFHRFNVEHIMKIVTGLSLSNNGSYIPQVLKLLQPDVNFKSLIVLHTVLELNFVGNLEDSFIIVDYMTNCERTDKRDLFIATYLKSLITATSQKEIVLSIINSITGKMKYSDCLHHMCISTLKFGNREMALELFEIMHEQKMTVKTHYYWPLFIHAKKNKGEAEIFRTIKHMLCLNVHLDEDTLNFYVYPYIDTSNVHSIVQKFNDIGLSTSKFIKSLFNYMISKNNLYECRFLYEKYSTMIDLSEYFESLSVICRIRGNLKNCINLLKYTLHNDDYPEKFLMYLYNNIDYDSNTIINKVIHNFSVQNIPVMNFHEFVKYCNNKSSNARMNKSISNLDSWKQSEYIENHCKMTIEKFERSLIDSRSKGLDIKYTLRELFRLHFLMKNMTKFEEITKEYINNGYQLSDNMISCLLHHYMKCNKIEEVENIYNLYFNNSINFTLNNKLMITLASALIKLKQIDKAIKIIYSLPYQSGSMLLVPCYHLLNNLADSEYSEMMDDIFDFIVKMGYCNVNNVVLSPMIRRHLLKNDLSKAVDTFRKIVKEHRYVPMSQALINSVLKSIANDDDTKREESTKLLKIITDIITDTCGIREMTIHIVFGLASNRMQKDLKKFIKDNFIPIDLLMSKLKTLSYQEKLVILPEILDCWPNMLRTHKIINYEDLLDTCSKSDDYRKAIEVWCKMSKDKIQPSRKCCVNFITLLKKHNVSLLENFERY